MTDQERQQRVQEAMAFAENIRDSEGEVKWKPIAFHVVTLADEVERLRGLLLEAQREHINPATGEPS